MASLTVFRNYLQDQADSQLYQMINRAGSTPRIGQGQMPAFVTSGYVVELRSSQGQLVPNFGTVQQLSAPGPNVPTATSWLSANAGKLVTVPATSGGDAWRVITEAVPYQQQIGPFQYGPKQMGTLIVGVNLGALDQTIAWLGKIDLLVSVIVILGLAVVGIAIVRASLRPLTDIEETARAIAAGDLSRRVPDLDPRTEVGRLGRSLNRMLAQIESSFQARTRSEAAARRSEERMRQFVADASHELRTPLTAMRGYAEYYRQRGGVRDDAAIPADASSGPASTGGASQPAEPPAPGTAPRTPRSTAPAS